MDHFKNLNAFVETAETGSFVAAARKTGLTASAVGKAVARLEQHLNTRLFYRDTRNMTLTGEGRLFLTRCHRILEEMEAAETELAQAAAAPSGSLRVSLPLAGTFLTPVLADFMRKYPAIRLNLDFSDRMVSLIEEGFDVVIRTGVITDSGLIRRRLGRFALHLVATPDYLARRGTPLIPEALIHHDCLRQSSSVTGNLHPWPLRSSLAGKTLSIPETMCASTTAPLVQLTEEGMGIACLPPFAIAKQISSGKLIPILSDYMEQTVEIAALWPTRRQLLPKIRVFVDFLANHLDLCETSIADKIKILKKNSA